MSQQEHLLSKGDETPTNLEQAETLLKRHEALLTTMDANDDKVNGVLQSAELLVQEEHFAADKISKKVTQDRIQQTFKLKNFCFNFLKYRM